jgi:hypothetical protein
MKYVELQGWDGLRHGGLLLDAPRLREVAAFAPEPLIAFYERDLRKRAAAILDAGAGKSADISAFVSFVLQQVCGFTEPTGRWRRGPQVPAEWGRVAVTGETIKPRHLWQGPRGGLLPVFIDREKRVGIGRSRKATSQVLQWLRGGNEQLALITNARQWRLVFAGLDFDAFCEWDLDLWLEEGELSPQVSALRTLLQPALWIPEEEGVPAPLLQSVLDSRKGQTELSQVLGERVREAVEILVQGHGETLKVQCADVDPADIYRAAVRVVMRLVVVLFAESRELLPRDNTLYHDAYGLGGLLEELEKTAARGGGRLARSWSAWPRVLALFRLVHQGSYHPSLPVPAYGGELFAPGDVASPNGLIRALAVFEKACFEHEVLPDRDVHKILDHMTRTKVKLRQGRASTWVPAPVDFSDLSSEYIGILYEGLLDFELKTAPAGDPVIFLAVGDQPALPLSRLEAMDDKALKDLLEEMKVASSGDEMDAGEGVEEPGEAESEVEGSVCEGSEEDEASAEDEPEADGDGEEEEAEDERHITRTRAETWARRAVEVGKLAKRPRGPMTPEKKLVFEQAIARKARQLVTRVVLPGEWYLVRWGGTRKGSGTFYTRPGLAVPTVQRTLRPLAWNPPTGSDDSPTRDAPPAQWTPKKPEQILALKVVDPACGSGTFPVAALRFLTDVLYASLHYHGRIHEQGDCGLVALLTGAGPKGGAAERLCEERLPCRPDDPLFEPRLKAVLRRHVVERCIYGVDLDPLAVELCRLALWVETMDRTLPFSFLDHKIKCGNALVGAWFDQFQHYPAMAWKNREGGDKGHTNGVHFAKDARTKAIKAFVKGTLTLDLTSHLIPYAWVGLPPSQVHDEALIVLQKLHALPVVDAAERARLYREDLLGAASWQELKAAFDRWCACWFWPADRLDCAPLPSRFANPSDETRTVTEELARAKRFFHWEIEFPDVFQGPSAGFHTVLGNPPWEIAKPNSKEFFSNIDPLYRSYGKQEALRKQTAIFADQEVERAWLDYNADFRAQSNLLKYAANPCGDPQVAEKPQDRFALAHGRQNRILHDVWRNARVSESGYADPRHPFRHQGSADINLYKLFLEQAHALLREGGRLGFIVPSGLYSDHGTGALRELFLDHCRWEWLFGFENREKIFDIDSRFKFNPVIIEKGGTTAAIRTAFMRRKLEDWEHAEPLATPYTRERVERFSPRSKAILEIQSARDLEILEKIYANSVLLGDDGPDGWGIKYATEFHMTNDSKLFPPRPKWEEQGYRPDEYSRWLKGDWRPIGELWAELDVKLLPEGEHRCAQPPYDTLPIPRADIPEGILLSRETDAWIREEQVEDVALPLYEGRMINLFDFSEKGWVTGKGRKAEWRSIPWSSKEICPQYLMGRKIFLASEHCDGGKIGFLAIGSATNMRSMYCSVLPSLPCGNSVGTLKTASGLEGQIRLGAYMASFVFDFVTRLRLTGLNLNYFVIDEAPTQTCGGQTFDLTNASGLLFPSPIFAAEWIKLCTGSHRKSIWKKNWALAMPERLRQKAISDAVIFAKSDLSVEDSSQLLRGCDCVDPSARRLNPKGFWRIDKDKNPELRHTVLTLVAFHDLQQKIDAAGGDRDAGIEAFCNQNDGEGWMLPETLRLADYGLGHDDRAKEHQPVASHLGPRFFDWQLAQSPEESWRECHLHARNLLGEAGYRQLLADLEAEKHREPAHLVAEAATEHEQPDPQGRLFE